MAKRKTTYTIDDDPQWTITPREMRARAGRPELVVKWVHRAGLPYEAAKMLKTVMTGTETPDWFDEAMDNAVSSVEGKYTFGAFVEHKWWKDKATNNAFGDMLDDSYKRTPHPATPPVHAAPATLGEPSAATGRTVPENAAGWEELPADVQRRFIQGWMITAINKYKTPPQGLRNLLQLSGSNGGGAMTKRLERMGSVGSSAHAANGTLKVVSGRYFFTQAWGYIPKATQDDIRADAETWHIFKNVKPTIPSEAVTRVNVEESPEPSAAPAALTEPAAAVITSAALISAVPPPPPTSDTLPTPESIDYNRWLTTSEVMDMEDQRLWTIAKTTTPNASVPRETIDAVITTTYRDDPDSLNTLALNDPTVHRAFVAYREDGYPDADSQRFWNNLRAADAARFTPLLDQVDAERAATTSATGASAATAGGFLTTLLGAAATRAGAAATTTGGAVTRSMAKAMANFITTPGGTARTPGGTPRPATDLTTDEETDALIQPARPAMLTTTPTRYTGGTNAEVSAADPVPVPITFEGTGFAEGTFVVVSCVAQIVRGSDGNTLAVQTKGMKITSYKDQKTADARLGAI